MRRLLLLGAVLTLAACGAQERTDADNRAAARSLVASVAAERFVGVTIGPIVDCTIENASDDEIELLVAVAVNEGMTGRVSNRINSLLDRPAARSCMSGRGVVLPR